MITSITIAVVAIITQLGDLSLPPHRDVTRGQWFHSFLRTSEAHNYSRGSGAEVGLVDTGVDAIHPDLKTSISSGTDLTDQGDSRIDTNGHGTAMAGLIAAIGSVTGIAPDSVIVPIRVSEDEEGAVDMLASGVRWAVTHKVEVISISRVITSNDLLLHQQIEAALIADIVVVAAAGNYPKDDRVRYPAAIPGVVAVAGVDRNGNRSKHSVTGPEVLIAAPSDDISSTGLNGTYTIASGTSNATAIVAGAVALVRARYPELKATEVVRRLTATAIDKGPPGRDDEYGYGVLNLVGALTAELPSATTAGTHPTASPTPTHPRPPYPEPARFPWWLTAVLPLTAAGIAAWLWVRLRRERRPR